tara:strand:- start:13650 stop:14141 length:492 start_codon:yes stop_codon:yes gene_type:complete
MILRHLTYNGNAEIQFRSSKVRSDKIVKWLAITVGVLFLVYVGSIAWFEVRLGYNQPQGNTSLVIATFSDDNERHERVLRLEKIEGRNYIAANHWPRSWYNQAINNPNVEVKLPGEDSFENYLAVPLEGGEEEHIRQVYSFGFEFRFRTGFPPRYFLRLDRQT